jgi:NitT/TauT family transport system substrate-binding protein
MRNLFHHAISLIVILAFFVTALAPDASAEKSVLRVACLPILDHLTLPIAYELSGKGGLGDFQLEPVKYTSWTELADAVTAGKVDGAFMLVPLGMHLRQKGVPLRLVLLGHRNGSALVVRPNTRAIEELKGGILSVPHLFSMQYVNLCKYLKEKGALCKEDFVVLDMAPPDMAPSLARGEIDGFLVAQPFPALAELNAVGRILAYSYQIWDGHVDCALYLLEPVISANHDRARELVRALVRAGRFIESDPGKASKLAVPYIGLNEEVIYKCLTDPPEGITYNDLMPRLQEIEEVQRCLLDLGLFERGTNLGELVDDRFAREAYE